MRRIDTSIRIAAEPDRVWRVLTDFSAYPEWNPFFVAVDGHLAPGARLAMHTKITATSKPRVFRVTVRTVEAPRRLVWDGGFAMRGLGNGEHGFELSEADGATILRNYEHFSGLVAPLLGRLAAVFESRYHELNQALADRVSRL